MNRASIGVQDFDLEIQKAIGRDQTYEITREVALKLRDRGIASLNADILYGLPHQTGIRIADSVQKLLTLSPDRVALYGYAHVPWMSRRQQMIPSDAMPTPEERLKLFETARRLFLWDGYEEIGIDHFARPTDGMARAQKAGLLRRNFQGYTDDTAPALIGLWRLVDQPVPAGICPECQRHGRAHQGHPRGAFQHPSGPCLRRRGPAARPDHRGADVRLPRFTGGACPRPWRKPARVDALFRAAAEGFEDLVELQGGDFVIPHKGRPLTRMIARAFDAYDQSKAQHSAAI